MKPVAVIQHCHNVQPGHFASFLEAQEIPWQLFAIDRGESLPDCASAFSGLCFMGGPMSVNDSLPWISEELALIRQAVGTGIPVIGHCLGGQLMSRALGGEVTRNPVKEIGWGRVQATETPEAAHWLGEVKAFDAYQWHGETFSLPEGARRILGGEYCANQAYVVGPGMGTHLGMQFHIEMTEELIRDWNTDWAEECAELGHDGMPLPPSVQTTARQLEQMPQALPVMRAVADRLYHRWAQGLLR